MALTRLDGLDHRYFLAQDYAIINPRQVEAGAWASLAPTALAPGGIGNDPAGLPQLICLRSLQEGDRIDLLERADQWQRDNDRPLFSALLQSEAEPRPLAAHLSRHLLLTTPHGDKAWFRYYDPAVFQHLCWQWSAAQLATLLGRITGWTLHANGSWLTYRPAVPQPSMQLRLTAPQWRQLERVELTNRGWALLRRRWPDTAIGADVPPRLDAALAAAAETEGLQDIDDQMLFACQRLVYGPALHSHPAVRNKLDQAREGACGYTRSCTLLSDADYHRLATEATECEGAHA